MPKITPTVLHADCLDVLRKMPADSVHAIVTDPPYGLSNTDPAHVVETLTRWASGDRTYTPSGRGFMGKEWDAFVPPPAVWDECLRVLKPGGHLLAFAGSRTFDLMTLSIRFAGFDIRDGIAWLYASGFPKSLDVSKAIDKTVGAEREVVSTERSPFRMADKFIGDAYMSTQTGDTRQTDDDGYIVKKITAPATDNARTWQGWGTALKPAFEPIVVARKPLAGTVAANVLAHGTGALNIDATRVATDDVLTGSGSAPLKHSGTNSRPFHETAVPRGVTQNAAGRWPTNVVLDGDTADALDEQSGTMRARGNTSPTKRNTAFWGNAQSTKGVADAGDSGGASRFFPTFRYQAKAPTRERPSYEREDGTENATNVSAGLKTRQCNVCGSRGKPAGGEHSGKPWPTCGHDDWEMVLPTTKSSRVAHPTVKPLGLMRWLVRLVTPPGGTVLDPFAGSGATVEAAMLEGFEVTAVERDEDYLPLIAQRIQRVCRGDEGTLDL